MVFAAWKSIGAARVCVTLHIYEQGFCVENLQHVADGHRRENVHLWHIGPAAQLMSQGLLLLLPWLTLPMHAQPVRVGSLPAASSQLYRQQILEKSIAKSFCNT